MRWICVLTHSIRVDAQHDVRCFYVFDLCVGPNHGDITVKHPPAFLSISMVRSFLSLLYGIYRAEGLGGNSLVKFRVAFI